MIDQLDAFKKLGAARAECWVYIDEQTGLGPEMI